MKRFSLLAAILIMMTAISVLAAPGPNSTTTPAFPGTLANARYVYVASYDGDQFNPSLLPEDRNAISAVQDAIQNWGKLNARLPAVRSRHHHSGHESAFRRCDGRVRRARGTEGQLSLARHGPQRPRLGRDATCHPIRKRLRQRSKAQVNVLAAPEAKL
jgi:hypothetical protein